MKKNRGAFIVLIAACLFMNAGFAINGAAGEPGEALFKQFCAVCHVDGGNIVNAEKTLHKKDLDAHNIKTEEDIIKIMRNPGPGMTKFNEKTVPDKQAKEIALYILNTLK